MQNFIQEGDRRLKKGDYIWLLALFFIIGFLTIPQTHKLFVEYTKNYPYTMSFLKVAVLATLGELLAVRILAGKWVQPVGVWPKAVIWGLIGMSFVIVFEIFATGVTTLLDKGLLPTFGQGLGAFSFAFWTSTCMNFFFAPTMMAFHRITDTYLEAGEGRLAAFVQLPLADVIRKIDWGNMIGFVFLKTLPLFWVPAHTLTFLLPPEYRVLSAAFLSIALGAILAFAKRKGTEKPEAAIA